MVTSVQYTGISIHALREEGDLYRLQGVCGSVHFYPRPPRGGRLLLSIRPEWCKNFYPRPPRGGRLQLVFGVLDALIISIHALREEGDDPQRQQLLLRQDFYPRPPRGGRLRSDLTEDEAKIISIHALREEGDKELLRTVGNDKIFLSTPSARRATPLAHRAQAAAADFYPRPPRGGRPGALLIFNQFQAISIHALREEGDCWKSG